MKWKHIVVQGGGGSWLQMDGELFAYGWLSCDTWFVILKCNKFNFSLILQMRMRIAELLSCAFCNICKPYLARGQWFASRSCVTPFPFPDMGQRSRERTCGARNDWICHYMVPFILFYFLYIFKTFFISLMLYLIYLFLAALGLRCCARAFSSCRERGLLFVAVRGLLIAVASHCGARALGAWASVVVARRL